MSSCIGLLVCPVCGERLSGSDGSLRCPRRHTFDRAREGYVDLLPAGHGRSELRGDTREMVQARRRFLGRGFYEPLSQAIDAHADRYLSRRPEASRALTALEAGCGEGYYIGRLARAVPPAPRGHAHCFFGLDLSKEAVRRAARVYREVLFFTGDVKHRIAIADGCVDLLLNVFAPRNPAEFARVLRPCGVLLVAIPREDHLSELRARLPLLGIEPDKRERTVELFRAAFEPEAEDTLAYRTDMAADAVLDLLRMTPNYWHLDEGTLEEVAAWKPVPVTIDVALLCLRRRGST